MKFIGIDPSLTGTAVVVLNEEAKILRQELISTKAKDMIEKRMSIILDKVKKEITSKDDIVYIEGLSFGSSGQATLDLSGLHYLITVMLHVDNIIFKNIPPGTLKKYVTGNGRAKKNLMLLKVYQKFGQEFTDDNICDAFCLARMSYEDYKMR